METKHTQGEWAIEVQNQYQLAIATKTQAICFIPKAAKNSEANAKLIAAAPDLLKACISALKDVQEINKMLIANGHHGYILMETELDEVIKKVTT